MKSNLSTDTITSQFRIKPEDMPAMSTPTMASKYSSIRKFQTALEENAFAIQSYETDLGHLALVIPSKEFLEAPFQEPINPGLIPPVPNEDISTRPSAENDVAVLPYTAASIIHSFNFAQQEYIKFKSTKAALRSLILNSIDETYIKSLKQDHTKYSQVSPLELMTYIWETYGAIDDADQTKNELRIK